MAHSLLHINIFVASPGDVLEERDIVASVVQELNGIFRTTLGVCLDIVRWETHAYPSIGIDAQDVINKQINDEYDIFIGLMWKRFGTKTERAGSGTEEEFDRAYKLHEVSGGATKVMMYFSDKKFSINEIDIDHIVKVRQFKDKTVSLGVLHWVYNDLDNLQQLLRLHIPKHVKSIVDNNINNESYKFSSVAVNGETVKPTIEDEDGNDELGFLDLSEIFHQRMSSVAELMVDMREDMQDLGERISVRTDKLNQINSARVHAPDDIKIIYNQIADDSTLYADKSNKNIAKFHDFYTEAITSLSKAITIQRPYIGLNELKSIEDLLVEVEGSKQYK